MRGAIRNDLALVSRFRSSHHCAAHSFANFGIKGTLAIYDSSAVFGFEVPTRTRGYNDRSFKSTALPPSEQPLDVPELQFDVSRAAVIALPGIGGRLHFAQQRIHFIGL